MIFNCEKKIFNLIVIKHIYLSSQWVDHEREVNLHVENIKVRNTNHEEIVNIRGMKIIEFFIEFFILKQNKSLRNFRKRSYSSSDSDRSSSDHYSRRHSRSKRSREIERLSELEKRRIEEKVRMKIIQNFQNLIFYSCSVCR